MKKTYHVLFSLTALCAVLLLFGEEHGSALPPKPKPIGYEAEVLPLFQAKCISCHGAGRPQGGLDLRTLGSVLQGGSVGKVVLAGKPQESRLYTAVTSGKMPPSGTKLTATEQKMIFRWIEVGAKGKTSKGGHWAFKPSQATKIPQNGESHPIDAFLKQSLQSKGLDFSPVADKRTLIRRVTYDLIGLPPASAEVDAFLRDTRPDAYTHLVDRLLASPHYGERWARYWLDIAGYADSEGVLQEDRIRPNAWRYRDYVIRSLNSDKPYNRFLLEQIAGDELVDYRNAKVWTPEIEEAVTATGFLRTAVDATRDDFNEHQFTEYQYRMLHDTQTILVSSTLGMTLQCARCHDHKYEPLSQKDYYRIQATLTPAIRPKGKLLPTYRRQIVAATQADQQRAKEVNGQIDTALQKIAQKEQELLKTYRAQLKEPKDANAETLSNHFPAFKTAWQALQQEKAEEERKRIAYPEIRALYDQDTTPPPTHLLVRGEYTRTGAVIEPGVPTILEEATHPFTVPVPAQGAPTTGRRRALAEWITHSNNPLTARVVVNRVWAHHFGTGIVASLDNFGLSGKRPTHPQLLDWLAVQLTRGIGGSSPWTLKALHRLIVTSRAYTQSSQNRPAALQKDPENILFWRQRQRRLDAEALRDGILMTTGTLNATLYGEPVGNEMRDTGEVIASQEAQGGRRSIYLLVRRSLPVTFLNVFDAPVMETNCTRRVVSTTPSQALTLVNSSFMESQARHFAERILKETPVQKLTDYEVRKAKISTAYSIAFGRRATEAEMRATLGFLQSQAVRYAKDQKPTDAERSALNDLCLTLLASNEFAYMD
jgi:hypothetical protein